MGTSKSREAVHMTLTVDDIAGHPDLHVAIRQQCRVMQQTYEATPGSPRCSAASIAG
jgi:hypothetical protein